MMDKKNLMEIIDKCRVNGGISSFGTVRVLDKSHLNILSADGWELYSDKLYKYARWKDECDVGISEKKIIIKKGRLLIDKISIKNLSIVFCTWINKVIWNGYLFAIGSDHSLFFKDPINSSSFKIVIENLRRIERGKKPNYFNNSVFIKVDSALEGRKVIVKDFYHKKDAYLVFSEEGEKISFQITRPFSLKRWIGK
ncbi:MAG: hypothetical protein Athens101410_555 [Parcubacteria group bacterium Athens1014_10]|nr:MAG: hypothetical protein Athens101410_555 [Parcubacteria group bacterium Athens1014_10]TSD04723.1 MAG: hypothetical protein Athens071412_667 [Parcubacteria group bacterium Athens0714_12]